MKYGGDKLTGKVDKIALLADSCCDIPQHTASKLGIFIVPLRIMYDETEYYDGVSIFSEDVYKALESGAKLTTSLPAGCSVEYTFNRIKQQGYNKVIALILSSGLSGTYNLIANAAKERCDLDIKVFDTKSGSLGAGMILYQVCEDIKNGMGWKELITERIPNLIANTFPYFSVDTLEYLVRGGRIGKITAVAGTLLDIKPILSFAPDGQLTNVLKARGAKQLLKKFPDLIASKLGNHEKFNLAVANGRAKEMMENLKSIMESRFPGSCHFWTGEIGATLSSYIGSGILGAAVTLL